MKKFIAKLFRLYTKDDVEKQLVSFGNYLLSQERGKRLSKEINDYSLMLIKLRQVGDGDLDFWRNSNTQ